MKIGKLAVGTIKQQRAALAGAFTVAVLLVGVFHAPLVPVLIGCVAVLALKLISAARHPEHY
jgi:hypothetical protein